MQLLEQEAGLVVGAVHQLLHHLVERGAAVEVLLGVIAVLAVYLDDFVSGQAEDEGVLLAGALDNLDVGAIEGTEGERAIHHELHV